LCNSEGNKDKALRYVKVLNEKQMDGMIFVATGDETSTLVGFDGIDLGGYAIPPSTTYAQPKTLIGQSAVSLLLERIQDHGLPARQVVLRGKLVARKSSGAKK
jgi:DNA-binding LacI/PurR family transcriptional regulator